MCANVEPKSTQSGLVPPGFVGLCWAKMRWVFSGEAVNQESLGAAP
jgi:hypothetical protein